MAPNPSHLTNLISHDGLKDSLTGLMSFPAFLESANRQLAAAVRDQKSVNLFLISLLDSSTPIRSLVVRNESRIDSLTEAESLELSARVLLVANEIEKQFRSNDLISRYTLTDFLIMNSGTFPIIEEKIVHALASFDVVHVGIEIRAGETPAKPHAPRETLPQLIAVLEEKVLALTLPTDPNHSQLSQ